MGCGVWGVLRALSALSALSALCAVCGASCHLVGYMMMSAMPLAMAPNQNACIAERGAPLLPAPHAKFTKEWNDQTRQKRCTKKGKYKGHYWKLNNILLSV